MPRQINYKAKELRARDAARKRAERLQQRDITLDFSRLNKVRRQRCSKSIAIFGRTYFSRIFYHPFSVTQKQIIADVEGLIRHGGNLARAAERGGGKSTIAKVGIIWSMVYGYLKWPVIIEANQDEANGTLEDIKEFFELPDAGDDKFGDDFPEICQPVRGLERQAMRAKTQTANGKFTKMKWLEKEILLPSGVIIPKGALVGQKEDIIAPSSGARLTVRGADKPIRGLVRKALRPDFALMNDIETEESADSLRMTAKIKRNIERAIKGLGGPGKSVSLLMLGTLLNNRCLIAQYTDPKIQPIWRGKRYRMVIKWPENMYLWDKYLHILEKGKDVANKFYKENRKAMDVGVKVSNPNRYEKIKKGADGKPLELSAIQHVYNLIAEMGGMDNFRCEYQNDPPEEVRDAGRIDQAAIFEKTNGLTRGSVPAGSKCLTCFVDVHDEKLFWAAVAWKSGAVGSVVNYGMERVDSPVRGTVAKEERPKQVEIAIGAALREFRDKVEGGGLGFNAQIDLGLVDCGYKTDVVYAFCNSDVSRIWRPARGYAGRTGTKFVTPGRNKKDVRNIKRGLYESYQLRERTWIWIVDSERYKQQVQNGFKVDDIDEAGSLSLFGNDPVEHRAFAEQICDEVWLPDERRYAAADGAKQARNNHWLDCTSGCAAAAAILDITVLGGTAVGPKPVAKKRKITHGGSILDNLPGL